MKFVQMFGLCILFGGVSLVLAGGFGVPKKEDVPKYMQQLKSTNAADRAKAAEMLGKRGGINSKDVEDAVEPLRTMLAKDKDVKVRAASARALGDIRADSAGTVPLLIDRLKSDSEVKDVKMAVVVALGQYGPDSKDALPKLREMLAKFDTKAAKKSTDAGTIRTAIENISGMKKKKN